MRATWAETGESMRYFSPGSSNKSTWMHSAAAGASVRVCRRGQSAKHLMNGCLWLPQLHNNTRCCKGGELKLHFAQSPPGAVVSTLPDEIPSSRAEKQQTGVGLLGWKFLCSDIQEQQQSASQLLTCLPREQTGKGHQRGNAHYLQPAAGANSKVLLCTWREHWRVYVISLAYHNHFL